MRYFVKGTDGNGRVFYVQLATEITYPEVLTVSRAKAWEFDTMAGADICEACTTASRLYGFQFFPEPVSPQMHRDDFVTRKVIIESCVLAAYLDRMTQCMGSHLKALGEFVDCCNQTTCDMPAFLNEDVLDDYSIRLGSAVLYRLESARNGTHRYSKQQRSA